MHEQMNMINEKEFDKMQRRFSNYDKVILAQPISSEMSRIFKEDRKRKLQEAGANMNIKQKRI